MLRVYSHVSSQPGQSMFARVQWTLSLQTQLSLALPLPSTAGCTGSDRVWHQQPMRSQDVSCGPMRDLEIIIFHPPATGWAAQGAGSLDLGEANKRGRWPRHSLAQPWHPRHRQDQATGLWGLSCFWMLPILRNSYCSVQKFKKIL